MFDEYLNVHKLPFYTHSLYSCFINETLGASWWAVAVCWGLQETKPKHEYIFLTRARSLPLWPGFWPLLPEYTDPTLLEVSKSPDRARVPLRNTQLTCSQSSLRFSSSFCHPAVICGFRNGIKHRHRKDLKVHVVWHYRKVCCASQDIVFMTSLTFQYIFVTVRFLLCAPVSQPRSVMLWLGS